MLKEEQTEPKERYLLAVASFADRAIKIWKQELVKRRTGKQHDAFYHKYLNWEPTPNEIAIFTMYAYADFLIPRRFDCIFNNSNPEINICTEYTISQSIFEGWYPIDCIEHGHKHLCILTFENSVPDILYELHRHANKYADLPLKNTWLGLCESKNLQAIIDDKKYIEKLKHLYGDNWDEHYVSG